MFKLLRPIVVAALHLATASACSPGAEETSRTTAMVGLAPTAKLIVGTKLDERLSKDVAVSGRDRLLVPDTDDWSCGRPLGETYASNVAWIELMNPSEDTLGLNIELGGLTRTHPSLFVYERKDVPVRECLTLAINRKLAGASSVVIEPTSSAYVLVSAGAATGVYTMTVRTEHIISP
jgi:hypothetical protein